MDYQEANAVIFHFNPLHREGGDPMLLVPFSHPMPNFNPLHREGGDCLFINRCWWNIHISIHSTARVET